MAKAKTVEELKKEVEVGCKAREKLEKIEAKEEHERNKKDIGKCFKYRNTYGGDNGWWLYAMITGVKGRYKQYLTFETTSLDIIEIKTKESAYSHLEQRKITKAEFRKAWKRLLKRLNAIEV